MADSDIEINLELIDNASSQLAEASNAIAAGLNEISDANVELVSSSEGAVSALNECAAGESAENIQ